MSPTLNQIQLVGRAGHDVDLHTLSDGMPLSRLRLYQNGENRAGESITSAFILNAWGALATSFHERVRRGDSLFIQGRLHIRTFRQDGVQHFRPEIHLSSFLILERTHHQPMNIAVVNSLTKKENYP